MKEKQALRKILAHNVQAHRERLGLSQDDLASESKVSLGMIRKIEQQTTWPAPDKLEQIATALDILPSDLFVPSKPITFKGDQDLLQLAQAWDKSLPPHRALCLYFVLGDDAYLERLARYVPRETLQKIRNSM